MFQTSSVRQRRVLLFCIALVLPAVFAATSVGARVPEITYATSAEMLAMFPKKCPPKYPYEARRAGLQGAGVFRMYIDQSGVVTRIGVMKSTGHEMLDLAASAGLACWRAKPGRRRELDMPVKFTLSSHRW
jgi:TonB family protein